MSFESILGYAHYTVDPGRAICGADGRAIFAMLAGHVLTSTNTSTDVGVFEPE